MSLVLSSQYVNMEGCSQVMKKGYYCPSSDLDLLSFLVSQSLTVFGSEKQHPLSCLMLNRASTFFSSSCCAIVLSRCFASAYRPILFYHFLINKLMEEMLINPANSAGRKVMNYWITLRGIYDLQTKKIHNFTISK